MSKIRYDVCVHYNHFEFEEASSALRFAQLSIIHQTDHNNEVTIKLIKIEEDKETEDETE